MQLTRPTNILKSTEAIIDEAGDCQVVSNFCELFTRKLINSGDRKLVMLYWHWAQMMVLAQSTRQTALKGLVSIWDDQRTRTGLAADQYYTSERDRLSSESLLTPALSSGELDTIMTLSGVSGLTITISGSLWPGRPLGVVVTGQL
ncbi:hypothetical protein RRG08_059370 [Elysia crispata]|uniref:Uncharacterized protein n=1 Tax=Elysia crispata TaxID=231223 RepID=A0AAE1BEL6_9GAST|nr:hypothetical protein RRG08_059370 [Elysia crispata]